MGGDRDNLLDIRLFSIIGCDNTMHECEKDNMRANEIYRVLRERGAVDDNVEFSRDWLASQPDYFLRRQDGRIRRAARVALLSRLIADGHDDLVPHAVALVRAVRPVCGRKPRAGHH
jgi:hypothetical protein